MSAINTSYRKAQTRPSSSVQAAEVQKPRGDSSRRGAAVTSLSGRDSVRLSADSESKNAKVMDQMASLRKLSFSKSVSRQNSTEQPVTQKSTDEKQAQMRSQEVISKNRGLIFDDTSGMGADLARLKDGKVIEKTLDKVSSISRDNVSYETTRRLSDDQLKEMASTPEGRQALRRMRDELGATHERSEEDPRDKSEGGATKEKRTPELSLATPSEREQIARLENVVGKPLNPDRTIDFKGKVPPALEKIVENGKIDLSQMTPDMYKSLSSREREQLVGLAASQKVGTAAPEHPMLADVRYAANLPAPQAASQYLLNRLGESDSEGAATADVFSRLKPEQQAEVRLSPESSRAIVRNLPQVLESMKSRRPNDMFDLREADALSNVIKQYPAENADELKLLFEQVSKSQGSLPADGPGREGYHRGWLTGVVVRGFAEKGDSYRERAKNLDMAGEFVDLVPMKEPLSVGIKVGLKTWARSSENAADEKEKVSKRVATEIRESWERDRTLSSQEIGNMRRGMENARVE